MINASEEMHLRHKWNWFLIEKCSWKLQWAYFDQFEVWINNSHNYPSQNSPNEPFSHGGNHRKLWKSIIQVYHTISIRFWDKIISPDRIITDNRWKSPNSTRIRRLEWKIVSEGHKGIWIVSTSLNSKERRIPIHEQQRNESHLPRIKKQKTNKKI